MVIVSHLDGMDFVNFTTLGYLFWLISKVSGRF